MRPHTILAPVLFLAGSAFAATPVHEFDASSSSNVLSGSNLVQWTDIGPGHTYSDGLFNINISRVFMVVAVDAVKE